VDRSSAQGTLVEEPNAPRGVGARRGPPLPREGPGDRIDPLLRKFFYYLTSNRRILVLYLSWI